MQTINALTNTMTGITKEDEHDLFARSLAPLLRAMPAHQSVTLKARIMTMVAESMAPGGMEARRGEEAEPQPSNFHVPGELLRQLYN